METSQIIKELEELGDAIDDAKRDKAQAEGRLQSIVKSLQQTYGISEDELDQDIERTNKRKSRVEDELQERYTKLKEEYEW